MLLLNQIRSRIDQKKGQVDLLTKSIESKTEKLNTLNRELTHSNKAHMIIQHVAQQTQKELQFYITDIVSLALAAVFPDPYKFELEFVTKSNKTAANFWFEKDGDRYTPGSATGGGPLDIAAFALRTSLWSLVTPRLRSILILDEPFRFLSKDLQPLASEMLKMISSKLGLQIIMVSHSNELIEGADRVFKTHFSKGITTIVEVPK